MRRKFWCICCIFMFLSSTGAVAQANDPGTVEARMRKTMLQYLEGIRNFICVQTVTRSVDTSGDGKKFKQIEVREDRLDYYANKAHYQVLTFNGKPVSPDKTKMERSFRAFCKESSTLK